MKITKAILDDLTAKAKVSERLRMNLDPRDSDSDDSLRMLNAIEPGSTLPIHRHQKTSHLAGDRYLAAPPSWHLQLSFISLAQRKRTKETSPTQGPPSR